MPLSTVAEELGVLPRSPDEAEAAQELAALGAEEGERVGTPLFFRNPEQRPAALRGQGATLQSQQILVAGMLRPAHLLDLIRNFTVWETLQRSKPQGDQDAGCRVDLPPCRRAGIVVAQNLKTLANRAARPRTEPATRSDLSIWRP
jgi:hypothetical protein